MCKENESNVINEFYDEVDAISEEAEEIATIIATEDEDE